jgi:hypothetical protein
MAADAGVKRLKKSIALSRQLCNPLELLVFAVGPPPEAVRKSTELPVAKRSEEEEEGSAHVFDGLVADRFISRRSCEGLFEARRKCSSTDSLHMLNRFSTMPRVPKMSFSVVGTAALRLGGDPRTPS